MVASTNHRPEEEQKDSFQSTDADFKPSQRWWKWNNYLNQKTYLRQRTSRRLDRHVVDKLPNLSQVGIFLTIWLCLISLLGIGLFFQARALTPYYTQLEPAAGGIYTEGIVGQATNFNPIYATTDADKAVARLVFANLFAYDANNQLQPVLAKSLTIDEQAQQYTLTLKENLRWHDGQPLTAADVVFTIKTIKNPQARSPLRNNWQGVNVDRIDDLTLTFTLSASFSPFTANLTLPVLPQHLLAQVPVEQLRDHEFNWQPVGSGPFIFNRLVSLSDFDVEEREFRIELTANRAWLQPVLLDGFHVFVVPSQARLTELFNRGQIVAGFNLDTEQISVDKRDYQATKLDFMTGVYLFFKNSTDFFKQADGRRAVMAGLDMATLLKVLSPPVQRIFGPLLPEHDGYQLANRPVGYQPELARRLLGKLGYQFQNGAWYKDNQKLTFTLTTQKETDYELLATEIKRQLALLGIEVILDLHSQPGFALEILQNHDYGDMLVYGLNLGSDADVYSYWHSSQIDTHSILRLNLAEYRSSTADDALEAGRSRQAADQRRKRYIDFQKVWFADQPALALYRFQLPYYSLNSVTGPADDLLLVNPSDRFVNVHDFAVRHSRQGLSRTD